MLQHGLSLRSAPYEMMTALLNDGFGTMEVLFSNPDDRELRVRPMGPYRTVGGALLGFDQCLSFAEQDKIKNFQVGYTLTWRPSNEESETRVIKLTTNNMLS